MKHNRKAAVVPAKIGQLEGIARRIEAVPTSYIAAASLGLTFLAGAFVAQAQITPADVDWSAIADTTMLWVAASIAGTAALIGAGLGLRSSLATIIRVVGKAFGR